MSHYKDSLIAAILFIVLFGIFTSSLSTSNLGSVVIVGNTTFLGNGIWSGNYSLNGTGIYLEFGTNLTGRSEWNHFGYPGACPTDGAVSTLDDSITCTQFASEVEVDANGTEVSRIGLDLDANSSELLVRGSELDLNSTALLESNSTDTIQQLLNSTNLGLFHLNLTDGLVLGDGTQKNITLNSPNGSVYNCGVDDDGGFSCS